MHIMSGVSSGFQLVGISGAVSTLVNQFTSEIGAVLPTVVGAVVLVGGMRLGLRWLRTMIGSIG